MRKFVALVWIPLVLVAGCGGGGGGGGVAPPPPPPPPTMATAGPPNVESLIIDAGPAALAPNGSVNTAFVAIRICIPGTTTCQSVDHIEVDSGSIGLRILADEMSASGGPFTLALPAIKDASGNLLAECLNFADGASWGTVATADIELPVSTERAANVPVQIIGSAAAGTPPPACTPAAPLKQENTVKTFGANGILGVGAYINDCNSTAPCTPPAPGQFFSAQYFTCSTSPCGSVVPAASVSVAQQVANPVALFATDRNGVIIELPAVADAGAANPTGGVLVFGIGTQSNNSLGSATVMTLGTRGTLAAKLNGSLTFSSAFLDSGSNANFFNDSSLTICTDNASFYCPANAPVPESVVLTGANNAQVTSNFHVGNADTLFNTNPSFTALPQLAGPTNAGVFDLGLPFFFGRNIYTGFETNSVGPYYAY